MHIVDIRDSSVIVQTHRLPKAPSAGQATPLCIRNFGVNENQVMICGRFPCVLMYDLRNGLSKCRSVYSGAESLSSMTTASRDRIIVGGSYRGIYTGVICTNLLGRGTLECIDTHSMILESKNRWTASSATILAVASRNSGIFAAGGSGTLRLLNGIQNGIRDIQLDRMITKIEVDNTYQTEYKNVADQVYLGCGTDGIACVEFGTPLESEEHLPFGVTESRNSLLRGEYSDMYYFRNLFR